jgi:uncharacterized repeat protein (TIGR01451 family)
VNAISSRASIRTSAFFGVSNPAAPSADLLIYNADDTNGAVTAGSNIQNVLWLKNNGPDNAELVSVSDPTPANTTFLSGFVNDPAWHCQLPAVGSADTAICRTPLLAPRCISQNNSGVPRDGWYLQPVRSYRIRRTFPAILPTLVTTVIRLPTRLRTPTQTLQTTLPRPELQLLPALQEVLARLTVPLTSLPVLTPRRVDNAVHMFLLVLPVSTGDCGTGNCDACVRLVLPGGEYSSKRQFYGRRREL